MDMDQDGILEISSNNMIKNIRTVYLAIGPKNNALCKKIRLGYTYRGKYVSRCPANTY